MLWKIVEVSKVITVYHVQAKDEEEAWNKYYTNEDLDLVYDDCDIIDNDIEPISDD